MTTRRFNYTSRRRIARSDVVITLRNDDNGRLSYQADFEDFAQEFPAEATVLVEAHQQSRYERFEHGTVGSPAVVRWQPLSDFAADERPRFRVKIVQVAENGRGRLLGVAEGLRPELEGEEPGARVSLLPVQPAALGHRAWELGFDPSPVLYVNKDIGDWRAVASSDEFRWLVFPQAVRQVMREVLFEQEVEEVEDLSAWPDQWLYFASRLPGVGPLPEDDRELREDWIDDVVEQFCATRKLMQAGRRVFEPEEGS
jgi:hypothetical protein